MEVAPHRTPTFAEAPVRATGPSPDPGEDEALNVAVSGSADEGRSERSSSRASARGSTANSQSYDDLDEELRIDSLDDGGAYSRDEFIEHYGGTAEWEEAERYSPTHNTPAREATSTSSHEAGEGENSAPASPFSPPVVPRLRTNLAAPINSTRDDWIDGPVEMSSARRRERSLGEDEESVVDPTPRQSEPDAEPEPEPEGNGVLTRRDTRTPRRMRQARRIAQLEAQIADSAEIVGALQVQIVSNASLVAHTYSSE